MSLRKLSAIGLFLVFGLTAMASDYVYVRSFSTAASPLPIAVDVNPTSTTCYYATFSIGPSSIVNVYMVRDFLSSTGPSDQTLIAGAIPFDAVNLRGFQGITVDSTGKVYASGDNGGGSTPKSFFKKYVPNGSKTVWTEDTTTWLPDVNNNRFSGVTRINDSLLLVPATGAAPSFINATTGAITASLPANQNYGREATFNPDNNDIYVAHNGSYTTDSLTVYNGGDPGTLGAYVKDTDGGLLGGIPTQYGTGTQCNGYDKNNHQLLHGNMTASGARKIEIYNVSTTSRGAAAIQQPPVQVISESTPGTALADVADAAAIRVNGVDYLLITSTFNSKIYVYAKVDNYEFAAGAASSVYNLGDGAITAKVSSSDLIHGVTGTVVSGGYHSATQPAQPTPGDDTPRTASLTDGVWASNGLTVIANDDFYPNPGLVVEYSLNHVTVTKIAVFAGHDSGGDRGFINCKVETDSGSGYTQLGSKMTTGAFGQAKPNNSVVSSVVKYDPAGLASDVTKIKFTFYSVSHNSTGTFKEWNDNSAPENNYPNQGTIIKEIDVFGIEPPSEVTDWTLFN